MKLIIAILLLFGLYAWEAYRPVPDWDKIQYEKYSDEAKSLSKGGVPAAILIHRGIDSEVGMDALLHAYPFKGKPIKMWIDSLHLSPKEIKSVAKYRIWLKQKK